MIFLGIDFGWHGKPSGLASLVPDETGRLTVRDLRRETALESILTWVEQEIGEAPGMIAVDAPTVIRNETGMREADRLMHRWYGRYHAGCYPANLGLAFAARTVSLGNALRRRGFRHAPELTPRAPGRYQIEVHPGAACVELFGLPRTLKYKRGRLAERRRALEQLAILLTTGLRDREPSLNWPGPLPIPSTGDQLKELEDQLDAVLAAYTGAHWWWWGADRSAVAGTVRDGYMVIPKRFAEGPIATGDSPSLSAPDQPSSRAGRRSA